MKNSMFRLLSAIMALAMVLGALIVFPLSASAAFEDEITPPEALNNPLAAAMTAAARDEAQEAYTMGTFYPVPSGATEWDKSKSASLSGEGTADSPYLIATAPDFAYFLQTASGAATENTYFKLTADIFMNATKYSNPLQSYTMNNFAGVLDGDGHSIYNAYWAASWSGTRAMFSTVSGTIKNINFKGLYNNQSTSIPSAGLALTLSGTLDNVHLIRSGVGGKKGATGFVQTLADGAVLSNCTFSGAVNETVGSGNYVLAGFAKSASGTVKFYNCVNYATLTANAITGASAAFVGSASGSVLFSSCRNEGSLTLTGTASAAGFLSAASGEGSFVFYNCVNAGNISGKGITASFAANFIPSSTASLTIDKCINTGDITASAATQAGGIVGLAKSASVQITNSANYGAISSAGSAVGGIAATIQESKAASISGSSNHGAITSSGASTGVGGILGHDESSATVLTDCYNEGHITAESTVAGTGGILGSFTFDAATQIAGCTNDGDITAAAAVGGILGSWTNAPWTHTENVSYDFVNCINTGNIHAKAADAVIGSGVSAGGFIGLRTIPSNDSAKIGDVYFYNCANHGNVTADVSAAGGLAGTYARGYNGPYYVSGYVGTGAVSAPTAAAAMFGALTANNHKSPTVKPFAAHISNVWIDGVVSATADDGTVAILSAQDSVAEGVSLHLSDSGFAVTVQRGSASAVVETPAFWVDSTGTGITEEYTSATSADFTNGTATKSLNVFAITNGYAPWTQGTTAPEYLTISGATMSLGGSMALNMKLSASDLASVETAVSSLNDIEDKTISVAFVNGDDSGIAATYDGTYYTVSYENLRASDMAQEMYLHIALTVNGVTSTSIATVYSPATYLANIAAKYEDDATTVAVAERMLAYGAAAEAHAKGIDFGDTAVAKLAAERSMNLPTSFTAENYTDDTVMTQADKDVINAHATEGVGAALTGGISLTFNGFTEGDTMEVAIRGEVNTYTADENGKIAVDMIYADMITDTIHLTFSDNATATMSVGNFLEGRRTGEEQLLANATIMYMLAVRDFVAAH